MSKLKLCEDCKYFWDDPDFVIVPSCQRPITDPRYGLRSLDEPALEQRNIASYCGKKARYFKPRTKIKKKSFFSLFKK